MKKFAIAFAALAAVTLVSSTTFAATPFCGTSSYYNSKYNTNYNHTASKYDWNNNRSYSNSRDYLDRYRTTAPYYPSLTDRLNSLYSNPWSKTPLFTDYSYRNRTNYNTYPSNSNRYDHDRYDHDRYDHNRYDYNRHSNRDWRNYR